MIEQIVSYGIIGRRGSYDKFISRFRTSQNTLIKIDLRKSIKIPHESNI